MTDLLTVFQELVDALNPKVIFTDGYGPITSLVLCIRNILTYSKNSMTEDLPRFGTPAYCASKFIDYPPMTDLSPVVQAVLDAFGNTSNGEYIEGVWIVNEQAMLAAALRAAADQVVPQRLEIYRDEAERIDGDVRSDVRQDLLAIAAELEDAQ